MKALEKITIVLATLAPLAVGACTTAGPSYTTSAPTATGAQPSGSSEAPGHYGDVFVDSPEPGFNPDTIIEAP